MQDALDLINQYISESTSLSFSSPRTKGDIKNINIQKLKEENSFKLELRHQKHNDIKTVKKEDLDIKSFLEEFKQVLLKTENDEIQILLNKKKKSKIITKKLNPTQKHNREKNYLIPDGQKCDFLIAIGVMDPSGRVKSNYYKKFRQINRFLEMLDDLYKNETKEDSEDNQFHIVDFGCGKSYLTFAIYYYFTEIKKVNVDITGVDLKQEVIDHCNQITEKLSYKNLKFVHGFIHDFNLDKDIDLVVTLHACDTATDDAILFSLDHNSKKMMFVPCCQHELNKQLNNEHSNVLLKHGIFKDRMTALVTDTMRTQLLEACGYKVQSMEFITLEHTAKNILLRCQKVDRSEQNNKKAYELYQGFKKQWNIAPYLEKKLIEKDYL